MRSTRAHRDNTEVASLLPVNPEEAAIGVRAATANAQTLDCLRLARLHPDDIRHVMRCNAQSAGTMRQANATHTLLLRAQAARGIGQSGDRTGPGVFVV
jgi:hypothetical protein